MRSITLRALVVGGGGAQGSYNGARNPGAGGGQVQDVDTLRFVPGTYTVVVGTGGAENEPGNYSEITGVLRSIGGGASYVAVANGGDGANGGGVTQSTATPGRSLVGGYRGGYGNNSSTSGNAGGGAGAGGDGQNGNAGGGGGAPLSSNISDTPTDYGAGCSRGLNGAGTANTGNAGHPGASGIVILRWNPTTLANAGLTLSFTGGSTTTGLSGGDSIRIWTASGSFVVGTRTDYELSGTAVLAGMGVSGATVRVIRMSTGETIDTLTTDGSGNFSCLGVSENESYHVTVEYENGGQRYNAPAIWDVVPVSA